MEKIYHLLTMLGLVIYWALTAAITIRILIKRRAIGVSLAWMMLIFVVPIGGVVGYILFGELNLGRQRASRASKMFKPYSEWFGQLHQWRQYQPTKLNNYSAAITALCEHRMGIPALADNNLELLTTTDSIIDNLLEDIHQAQTHIHMEFYIWSPGGRADEVANALISASKRNIIVRLLLDAAGSRAFFKSIWPEKLKAAGVQIASALTVSPFRILFQRIDLRLHRKIVVIDNKIAYTGSMNLVDPAYFKQSAGVGRWIDVMVRMTGANVAVLNCILAWDWETETQARFLPQQPILDPHLKTDIKDIVQVIPSGPSIPDALIQQVLLQSIYLAEKRIVITTPYFIPSESLSFALCSAAQKGIEVIIIIPYKNDSLMVEWASRSFFCELLKAGVQIYRFKRGLLHTKSVVIDEQHCLIGTVNLDMRSLWLNFEVTLAIDNLTFTQQLSALQQSYIKQSKPINLKAWQKRKLHQRFIEQFFYWFSPLL